jgi:hypothetical protein
MPTIVIISVMVRVEDPDTDPDPAFFLIADPDSGSGFDDIKWKKIFSWKF